MPTLTERVTALEKEQQAMIRLIAKILAWLGWKNEKPPVDSTAPAPGQAPAPAPAPEPAAAPAPGPVQVTRVRAAVTSIILSEFAKQTSFIPGGANGSATPAETVEPGRAIQNWVDMAISEMDATNAPEPELRQALAIRIKENVMQYGWAKSYPPGGVPVLDQPSDPKPPEVEAPIEPPSGSNWTDAQIAAAVACMRAPNEGLIANVPNGKPGWYSRGQVVMGGHLTEEGRAGWAPAAGTGGGFWPILNFWAVLFSEQGNDVSDGMVEIMDQEIQVLYRSKKAWSRVGPKNAFMVWGEHFKPDMITSFSPARNIWRKPGTLPNSMSFDLPREGAPHWIDGTGEFRPPNPSDIMGVMAKMRIRIDPRGNTNVRMLCHIGADSKPDRRLPWYPGVGVSSAVKVRKEWRDVVMINLASDESGNPPQNYGPPQRALTELQLRQMRPLA